MATWYHASCGGCGVVDLIRNCKKNIVLTLKEDRLAKLKARPFLAEGTLIEPPKSVSQGNENNTHDRVPPSSQQTQQPRVAEIRQTTPTQHHPPPQQQRVQSSRKPNNHIDAHNALQGRTRTVGSPKSYEQGTDGSYFYRGANNTKPTNLDFYSSGPNSFKEPSRGSPGAYSTGSSSRHSEAAASSKSVSPKSNRSDKSSKSSMTTATAHLYNLEDLPRSPRYYTQQTVPEPTFNSMAKKDKYATENYHSQNYVQEHGYVEMSYKKQKTPSPTLSNHVKSPASSKAPSSPRTTPVSSIHRHTQGRKYNSYDKLHVESPDAGRKNRTDDSKYRAQKSVPYTKKEGQFDFSDGCVQSMQRPPDDNLLLPYTKASSRPYSNPELDVELDKHRLDSNAQTQHLNVTSPPPRQMRQNKNKQSNHSSPNIYDDSQWCMTSEQKELSLTPCTLSSHSLSKISTSNSRNGDFDERIHSPLHVTLNNTSMASSSTVSPMSYLAESDVSSSVSSNTKEEVSPADIASRLFTLNGYKDSDIAPLLGKNSDFSQQICREYLRFFNFEGIALDEAVRIFLAKFPLTGETQERERILIHFSKRYNECNLTNDMDEDGVHTLVCSLMLLNTDLHGQSITNKMTPNDFVTNLSGLNNGKDFPKEYLKTLYNSIKNKEIKFAQNEAPPSPKHKRNNSGNPFIELKVESSDAVVYEGLVYRKSVMDPGGRRTPLMRRNWRPYYCVLKGLVLLSYKPDNMNGHEAHSIGIHHALAGYAKDYKKRMFVFKLISADWSVYYLQVKSQDEVKIWMDSINVSAALLSSPPLPAPVGSSVKFQRPVMPVSRTRLEPAEQLSHHMDKVTQSDEEYKIHIEYTPEANNKYYTDWENKKDYLEYEVKRFKAYVSVLTTPKLSPIRQKILATIPQASKMNTLPSPGRQKSRLANAVNIPRSSSMHSLTSGSNSLTPTTQRHIIEDNRKGFGLSGTPP
ncbi:PH and SEC7 domain-containing protein-like isoform X2 [Clytia hemisphaerica]|uniref:PH and SEC7 domain-containing protein-like isoform X2 n=1 Tax=Clytia hemisphaerica TaxID=252671 RepID=UPI0034D6A809